MSISVNCPHCMGLVEVEVEDRPRTNKQNSAMWLYCDLLAEALNDAGFTQQNFPYREGISIPWTKNSVMEVFWRPVQRAMLDKASTTKQSTRDVQAVYQALDAALSERVGVHVEWPSIGSQMMEAMDGKV